MLPFLLITCCVFRFVGLFHWPYLARNRKVLESVSRGAAEIIDLTEVIADILPAGNLSSSHQGDHPSRSAACSV